MSSDRNPKGISFIGEDAAINLPDEQEAESMGRAELQASWNETANDLAELGAEAANSGDEALACWVIRAQCTVEAWCRETVAALLGDRVADLMIRYMLWLTGLTKPDNVAHGCAEMTALRNQGWSCVEVLQGWRDPALAAPHLALPTDSAAYQLAELGHEVRIQESSGVDGGAGLGGLVLLATALL